MAASAVAPNFVPASLFTSVVSFGISALVMGLAVIIALAGYALFVVSRNLSAAPEPAAAG